MLKKITLFDFLGAPLLNSELKLVTLGCYPPFPCPLWRRKWEVRMCCCLLAPLFAKTTINLFHTIFNPKKETQCLFLFCVVKL